MQPIQVIGLIALTVVAVSAPYITHMFAERREWHSSQTNRVIVTVSAFGTASSWATGTAIVIYHVAVQPDGVTIGWWSTLAVILAIVGLIINGCTFGEMRYTVVDSRRSHVEDHRNGRVLRAV